ncbi:helix-turn-helix transcriptional regulator [Actinomadura sp. DC4]|uniref:helix-turn-helix domain-containing protein n=1 Tax=Actinomadura sp. DC4 TaxID=3055069 RepID=UPI0025B16239|nr:helix-turn-helix transcriptional regulator [Actinomadura sp. DC4]MDN3356695.1 helix-turn-helix transcriptional regulator [Actinomadura sp. DC4]
MPDELPHAVRTLLGELRLLKDRSGYDLRALASKTHASRSSWGRWLSGETWIPREAVANMASLCAGDADHLNALWQRAEDERRARQFADAAVVNGASSQVNGEAATDGATRTMRTAGATLPGDLTASGGQPPAKSRRSLMIFTGIVVGCAIIGGAAGLGIGLSLRGGPAQGPRPYTQWLARPEVLSRLQMWHPHSDQRVPYSQSRSFQGYRTDGSGYASMALGLPTPGPNSPDLASGQYSHRITPAELLSGDLIINPTGDAGTRQVMIFDKWLDGDRKKYWVYQQRRGYGTDHLAVSFPLDGSSQYHAYRPLNIHDVGTPGPP